MQERQIFWSGGIGDIFALESTFTEEERFSILRMYWGTRAKSQMAPLFTRLPSYKNLIDHISLWDEFPPGFCFRDLGEAAEKTPYKDKLVGTIEDWSILKRFCKNRCYESSSFIKYRVGNIVRFHLPRNYVTVCPYSNVNVQHIQSWRRFHAQDWEWLLDHLKTIDSYGVVVNTGDDFVPQDDRIIDLSNKTNLAEAIEVVKGSHGYYGIDSCFCVLASFLFDPDQMVVSTLNKVFWQCRRQYCCSQYDFSFIKPWLGATDEERLEWIRKSEATPPLISGTG